MQPMEGQRSSFKAFYFQGKGDIFARLRPLRASVGFAEVCEDVTAVKPWSFTGFDALLSNCDR